MFGVFKRLIKREGRLEHYFLAAVGAHLAKGDETAGLMAFLAAVEAPASKAEALIAYLEKLWDEIQHETSVILDGRDDLPSLRVMIARLDMLLSRIPARRWGRLNTMAARRQLRKLDPESYRAHTRMDPELFYNRYPELREDIREIDFGL